MLAIKVAKLRQTAGDVKMGTKHVKMGIKHVKMGIKHVKMGMLKYLPDE